MPNRSSIAARLVLFTGLLTLAGCNNDDNDCQNCGVTADPPAIINGVAKRLEQFNDFLSQIFPSSKFW